MRGPGYTSDQLAFIRESAPHKSDVEIGAALGFKPSKVLHIRQRNGIAARVERTFWTDERTETMREMYLIKGLTSETVAKALETTSTAVRRKAQRMGWGRDPLLRKVNQASAQKRLAPARRVHRAPVPKPSSAGIRLSDQALIAEFLATKGVTKVASGLACGLSSIETQFGAYRPNSSWHDQRVQAGKNAASRKATEAMP